jgi:hypothetical protein
MVIMFRSTSCLLLALSLPAPLLTQTPPTVTLGPVAARHATEFSLIRGVRELADGSVLVVDPIEKLLVRLDPTLQRREPLGRTGRGPGEFLQPDGIWPLPADSALLVDLGNNRLTTVDPGGRLGGSSIPILGSSEDPETPSAPLFPGAIDRLGRLWYRGQPVGDSLPIFRLDRSAMRTSKVGMLRGPAMTRVESGTPNNRSVSISPVLLSPEDGWAATASGLLYIVRAMPFHVEVTTPTGSRVRGQTIPYTPVRIGDAEKREIGAAISRNGAVAMSREISNGAERISMGRERVQSDVWKTLTFPATKPPFDAAQIFVDPTERLWVRRHMAAGQPAQYDIFSTAGARVASVRLPAGRRLVGFGVRGLYAVDLDEDDLQYLERYPIPR